MAPGQILWPGQSRTSAGGAYTLVYQGDGNLVLYHQSGWATWASGTAGISPGAVYMQTDGNLVIYSSWWGVAWASWTHNNPGAYLVVQDDGNVVVYNSA